MLGTGGVYDACCARESEGVRQEFDLDVGERGEAVVNVVRIFEAVCIHGYFLVGFRRWRQLFCVTFSFLGAELWILGRTSSWKSNGDRIVTADNAASRAAGIEND